MPIKPENRARYPKDWPEISHAARARAKWRCQHPGCTAMQYSVGRWICFAGGPHEWRPVEGNTPATTAQDREFFMAGEGRGADGTFWTYGKARAFIDRWSWGDDGRPLVIVLTVAHLNHEPEDCRPENLAAMCQRHHLAYDAQHHKQTAYTTRKRATMTADLFDAA
jgi:hypothetical protein